MSWYNSGLWDYSEGGGVRTLTKDISYIMAELCLAINERADLMGLTSISVLTPSRGLTVSPTATQPTSWAGYHFSASGVVTGAAETTPILITSAGASSLIQNGEKIEVENVGGNTAANGTFLSGTVTSYGFRLYTFPGGAPVPSSGPYTEGGTWYRHSVIKENLTKLQAGVAWLLSWEDGDAEQFFSDGTDVQIPYDLPTLLQTTSYTPSPLTLTAASNDSGKAKLTISNHGFVDGQVVCFDGVSGATGLNGGAGYVVEVIDTSNFYLKTLPTGGSYVSGTITSGFTGTASCYYFRVWNQTASGEYKVTDAWPWMQLKECLDALIYITWFFSETPSLSSRSRYTGSDANNETAWDEAFAKTNYLDSGNAGMLWGIQGGWSSVTGAGYTYSEHDGGYSIDLNTSRCVGTLVQGIMAVAIQESHTADDWLGAMTVQLNDPAGTEVSIEGLGGGSNYKFFSIDCGTDWPDIVSNDTFSWTKTATPADYAWDGPTDGEDHIAALSPALALALGGANYDPDDYGGGHPIMCACTDISAEMTYG